VGLPSVSIIIPVYNAGTTIDAQLASLVTQSYGGPWEIIAADNGSHDDSVARVRAWTDRFVDRNATLEVVDASATPGAGSARNAGARQATGDLLLFCDADDTMGDGWLAAMVEALGRYDLVGGAVETALLNPPPRSYWGAPVPDGEHWGEGESPSYCIGSNFGLRRAVFEAIGGWSEDYPKGGDDQDICRKAILAGFRQGFAPEAVVHRRHRSTLRALARQHYGYGWAAVQLHGKFRGHWPGRSLADAVRAWLRLVKHVPDVLRAETRGAWVSDAALQAGRLAGCVHHRVFRP
jgi:glycosyltransferase involved in cell wall biosynthesis